MYECQFDNVYLYCILTEGIVKLRRKWSATNPEVVSKSISLVLLTGTVDTLFEIQELKQIRWVIF